MTALELIIALSKLPPDTKIYTSDMEYGTEEVNILQLKETYIWSNPDKAHNKEKVWVIE